MSSITDALPSIISIPPDSSHLLLDSRFRSKFDSIGDFGSYLNNGVVAKELQYNSLFWSFPIFTHNLGNNEIFFRVHGNAAGDNQVFAAYIRPWVTFTQFDGNSGGGGGFNTPLVGSYGYELALALNDSRKKESNAVAYGITVGGVAVVFSVVYNPSVGFLISANAGATQVAFRFESCSWFSEATNVHGFGQYDVASGVMQPKYFLDPTIFYNGYISDTIPNLTISKYLIAYSEELSRERKLPSFKNFSDSSGNGQDHFNNEMAIIPVLLSYVGQYNNFPTINSSVISVRSGSETQYVRIRLVDNQNRKVLSGNPLRNFLQDVNTPASLVLIAFNSAVGYRNTNYMNYLLFGNATANTSYQNPMSNYLYGDPLTYCLPDDLVHDITVIY